MELTPGDRAPPEDRSPDRPIEAGREVSARLEAVHPVLMASDILASLRFFDGLGFRETFRDSPTDPRYAAVTRDGVELHLQWHEEADWAHSADRPTYRFLVVDVDALFAEFVESGALVAGPAPRSPWASPGDTPWGTREFHVRDPDGNGLQFYQPVRP